MSLLPQSERQVIPMIPVKQDYEESGMQLRGGQGLIDDLNSGALLVGSILNRECKVKFGLQSSCGCSDFAIRVLRVIFNLKEEIAALAFT